MQVAVDRKLEDVLHSRVAKLCEAFVAGSACSAKEWGMAR